MGLPLATLTWVEVVKKIQIKKKINARFNKWEFSLLKIEKYFYYFKFSKEERVQYIYGAFTRNVQLWWDDFQDDFFGFPPINTCKLIMYLLIEECCNIPHRLWE